MKPRLLIFTNRLVVGGISNDVIPLAYYLKDTFDILIICGETEKGEASAGFLLEKYPGLSIKKIKHFRKNLNPVRDAVAFFKIRKIIREFGCNIVHTHGAKSGFLGRLAAHQSGVPCIIHTFHGHHFHSYYNHFISNMLVKMERWMTRISTRIIATSEQQWHDLVIKYKIAPPEKVVTIPLGIDQKKFFEINCDAVKTFRGKFGLENFIAVGLIARITEVKNFDLFMDVARKLLYSAKQPVKFFIIGDGILKKSIQQKLSAKKITWCDAENFTQHCDIIFTSWIANVADVISALDIVMLTSNNEGTGLSLVEAQLCGKPVVATNVGGVSDTVINEETGFLVEPNNADAMVNKLKLLIENAALRKSMGEKAAAFASKNFSKQTEVENYKQLYTTLLAQ